jgi:hypothetical protein
LHKRPCSTVFGDRRPSCVSQFGMRLRQQPRNKLRSQSYNRPRQNRYTFTIQGDNLYEIQEPIGTKSLPPLDGVNEAVRKMSKRVSRKDKTEEFTPNPSPEPHAESRTIKNAEKQRRNQDVEALYCTITLTEQDNSRPQKSRAQKSLRRVGSDASLPREVLEGIIQKVPTCSPPY